MIDFARVANNILVLLIIFGLGYMIYSKFKGNKTEAKLNKVLGIKKE